MLDATQIKDMDGAQKLALLLDLSQRTMAGATVQAQADRLGVSLRTLQNWKAVPDSIPPMALMLLEAWAEQKDATGAQRALGGVAETMEQLAGRLGDLAREMKPQPADATL